MHHKNECNFHHNDIMHCALAGTPRRRQLASCGRSTIMHTVNIESEWNWNLGCSQVACQRQKQIPIPHVHVPHGYPTSVRILNRMARCITGRPVA